MNDLDHQSSYWNKVADKKNFTHPINLNRMRELLSPESSILDYGCGYGRTCAQLKEAGFNNVTGVDISTEMIKRGHASYTGLDLRTISDGPLPYPDHTFHACTLFAVLTCIPTNTGQLELIDELSRVLQPGGILYLSDYPLQEDSRNIRRYRRFESEFGTLGVFRLSDGGVVRHHDIAWLHTLLEPFDLIQEEYLDAPTMHGNRSTITQIFAGKNS